MEVCQFSFPRMAVAELLHTGATVRSAEISRSSASASASLNGAARDAPPGPRCLPGWIISRLLPMLEICSVTCLVAPPPSVTRMITAATPIMMPSIVRNERITLRRNSRNASNRAFSSIGCLPMIVIMFYQAIAKTNRSLGIGGHVRLMSDH